MTTEPASFDPHASSPLDRRSFLRGLVALGVILASPGASASELQSTFKRVYGDPELRETFFPFLHVVFHLYPEKEFHQLIQAMTLAGEDDESIYREIQAALPTIRPLLSDLRYSVPALRKQKAEMTRQSSMLVGEGARPEGYLEIGTPGRYVRSLRAKLDLQGPVFLLHDQEPGFGPVDVLERGSVTKVGEYLPLGNYEPIPSSMIPDQSLDLVSNFIGFHHCPVPQLDAFIASVRRVLRPGGVLILREHDVTDPRMEDLVTLAHDVFNAGVMADWEVNAKEYRRFRSVAEWEQRLAGLGLRREGEGMLQPGDPTANTLLRFVRV